MISDLVKLAKIGLADVDRNKVIALLDCINLTTQEREIIERAELKGERLYDIADLYALSIDSVAHIKRNAMQKIGIYLTQKLQ